MPAAARLGRPVSGRRIVVANTADLALAYRQAQSLGDVLLLNEVRANVAKALASDVRRNIVRLTRSREGQNVVAVRTGKAAILKAGSWKISAGGRIGLGGRGDRRRLGPGRDAAWALLSLEPAGGRVIVVVPHFMARAFTVERWRLPAWKAARLRLLLGLRVLRRRYPGVPIIVAGDGNDPHPWQLGKGWTRHATPADLGRLHYTQVHTFGAVQLGRIIGHDTASDHDALAFTVSVTSK